MDHNFVIKMHDRRADVERLFDYKGCKVGQGTYGNVYKAKYKSDNNGKAYALKQLDGSTISLSVCREVALLRELKHQNVISLIQVFFCFKSRSIFLLIDYAEYDLFQIIKYHNTMRCNGEKYKMSEFMIKSIMYQMLTGLHYLHNNWVLHRDIKPANILVMGDGIERGHVKIADMGLSRIFKQPLKPLTEVDPVVVTFWYRAPELLLGSCHYTKAIDMWATGCIFAELLIAVAIFQCSVVDEDVKTPYNPHQLHQIFKVMGYPQEKNWKEFVDMPQYQRLLNDLTPRNYINCSLNKYMIKMDPALDIYAFDLLRKLLSMDPNERMTSEEALSDPYFYKNPLPGYDVFESCTLVYPKRIFIPEEAPPQYVKTEIKIQTQQEFIDSKLNGIPILLPTAVICNNNNDKFSISNFLNNVP